MSSAIVVGAGVGGLSAAIELLSQGWEVTVVEAHETPGGKANTHTHDAVAFDTGPSILTLPDVFRDLFARAGADFDERVRLVSPSPVFRYLYPDRVHLDVEVALDGTLTHVEQTLGSTARAELTRFLDRAKRIWDIAGPRFVYGPAPTFARVLSMGPLAWMQMLAIDARRDMLAAIRADVSDWHLQWLLARYATYNGSDPRVAPATLNCIAWVELGLGGYGVAGGMHALVQAMCTLIEQHGGVLHLGRPVRRLERENGRVCHVVLDDEVLSADAIVVNADVAHLVADLLPETLSTPRTQRSTSGLTAVVRSAPTEHRVAHTVVFPHDYEAEFADMFDAQRPPADPTVYACDQTYAHERTPWHNGHPVFLMANAPAADPDAAPDTALLRDNLIDRAVAAGLVRSSDDVVWTRTPKDLAQLYPRTGGAIYGAASTDRLAAFRRPANRTAVPGLYLASGSVHPGGGVPLCALSGVQAATSIVRDGGRSG